MSGLPFYPAPAMLLHYGRRGSMTSCCCNCSPYCPVLLPQPCLRGFSEVTRKEPPQALSLHLCSTSSTQPAQWAKGRGWPASVRILSECFSPSDPLTPSNYLQSSFCIGTHITDLAYSSLSVPKAASIWSCSSPLWDHWFCRLLPCSIKQTQLIVSKLMWHFSKRHVERKK